MSATSAVTSKVKGGGRKVTVLADKSRTKRSVLETPKLVERLPTHGQQCLHVSRTYCQLQQRQWKASECYKQLE